MPKRHPPCCRRPWADDDLAIALLRHDLLTAMAVLSRGQRAVVVCRYFDDLTEQQTAATLGCSVGTVKSQASRALAALRISLADNELTKPGRES